MALLAARTAAAEEPPIPQNAIQPPDERVVTGDVTSPLRPGLFHLNRSDAYLELESSLERRRVNSSAGNRLQSVQRNREWRFSEALGLSLSGDVIDPEFLAWDAGLKLGLSQERFREQLDGFTRTDTDSGELIEYDLSLDLLRSKPVSVNAYARRSRDRVPRRFLPSLLEQTTESGASVYVTGPTWTTELGFSLSDVDRSGNRLVEDDEHLSTRRFYVDSRWEISDDHGLRLNFDHEDVSSEYQGGVFDFDTRRDELRLEHELEFGPATGSGARHRLDTFARWNDEHGDLARDEAEFSPRLTLRHSDAFQTVYRYSYNRTDQDAIEVERHKLDVQALFKPNDRWRISANGYWLRERVEDDLETYEAGGGLDAAYRRRTPWGEFSGDAAFIGDRARTVGETDGGVVRGEGHQLGGSRPVFLRQPDVRPGTIVAYNAARTRAYVPGLDYLVTPVGRRMMVRRILSGDIPADDVVLFDYQYRVPLGSRVDSYRMDLYLEHAFRAGDDRSAVSLTPYYGWEQRWQFADNSRGVPVFEDNTERHRAGLRYDGPRVSLTGEYELFNDTNDPYEAFHLTGRGALFRDQVHALDLTAELSRYRFNGEFDQRKVWWLDVDVTDRLTINPYWSATVSTAYRWEDDSLDGTTNGVDVECGLHFERGQLGVDLTVEYDLLRLADNRDEGFGMWVNVRRSFGDVLGAAQATRYAR